MNNEPETEKDLSTENKPNSFPATVAAIIDKYTVVINRGRLDGIKFGQKFLIYGLSEEEIIDPETKQSLGYLEIVRGRGEVVHLQERLAAVKSITKSTNKRIVKRKDYLSPLGVTEETETDDSVSPFDSAGIGDKARLIG